MTELLDVSRRSFIKLGLAAALCVAARPAMALAPRAMRDRALSFHNLHTDERLHVTYWKDGSYSRAALEKINHALRDFRTGDVFSMRPALMDLLHDLQTRLGDHGSIEVISGYRSPRTNYTLASASSGVARNSYHMRGMAIDIRLPGTALSRLRSTALSMGRGGVGYYPSSDFVHVDVGPVRHW